MESRGLAQRLQRLPIAIAAVMVLLLAILAVLQWRWIGEVSAMERHRMRMSLFAAGSQFTEDFDREATRAFLYFHPDPMAPAAGRLDRVIRQYDRWNAEAPYPRLVRDVFVLRPAGDDGETGIEVLWPAEHRFVACPWPPELARPQGADYALAVKAVGDPRQAVFLSDPRVPAVSFGVGDMQLDMFRLRPFDELRGLQGGHVLGVTHRQSLAPPRSRLRGQPPGERRREGAAWRLILKHRDGSLEDAVTAIRRRNLAISLGILTLLAATMGLMMAATQRAQRLARQQIEFVAGVTHELNTPLTAIRSAGQNLAAGVVAEPVQVRRYGHLIESEGRRLSDMVGQALELAGIQSGRRVYHPRPVEVGEIVDGALQDCRWLLQEKHIAVDREVDRDLPAVLADAAALRRAVQNLIENAVKYGGQAGWIGVRARRAASGAVEVTVADRGPGIRREDLPHLFEPFFRGRDAARGGTPGSGLGLSLVRHVVEAHGGRITVATGAAGSSGDPEGSAFTLHLPALPAGTAAAQQPVEEPA